MKQSLPGSGIAHLAAVIALALGLHLILGWPWVVLAGILAGLLARKHAILLGAAGVAAAWILLIGWSFAIAGGPIRTMLRAMGALMGGMPGRNILFFSVALGAVLGMAGTWLGSSLAAILAPERH